jgi:hypothetical protein
MCFPEGSQQLQGALRQRHIAIFIPLAPVDVNEHAVGMDVGDLKMGSFLEAKSQRIDCGETRPMPLHLDGFEDPPHLRTTENDRKLFLFLGTNEAESDPPLGVTLKFIRSKHELRF